MKFVPHRCSQCHQTTNYDVTLSRGAGTFLIAFYNAVQRLNRNLIHFGDDMVRDPKDFNNIRDMIEGGWCTHKMSEGFGTVLHRHGLIASTGRNQWLMTRKGADFLRGSEIYKTAIANKTTGHQSGYWESNGKVKLTTLLKTDQPWWAMPEAPAPQEAHTFSLFSSPSTVQV